MGKRRWILHAVAMGLLTVAIVAWAGREESGKIEAGEEEAGKSLPAQTLPAGKATASIEARSGSSLSGTADFVPQDGKMRITVVLKGAPPGPHAVHIHEKGDCSAQDASSAGPHFNPGGHRHGSPGAPEHHAGDLGNISIGEDGTGTLVFHTSELTVAGEPGGVTGRAIIIHEKPDDFVTDPTGAAGGRIGCGVITSAS